jgi:hypothetical protein
MPTKTAAASENERLQAYVLISLTRDSRALRLYLVKSVLILPEITACSVDTVFRPRLYQPNG